MTKPVPDYVVKFVPRVIIDGTPSGSTATPNESDPLYVDPQPSPDVAPAVPAASDPSVTSPAPRSPVRYPHVSDDGRIGPSRPPRSSPSPVPTLPPPHDVERFPSSGRFQHRDQVRKTTYWRPQGQLAPRDFPRTTYEQGESSAQAGIRAQIQQMTVALHDAQMQLAGTHRRMDGAYTSIQQTLAAMEQTRATQHTLAEQMVAIDAGAHTRAQALEGRIQETTELMQTHQIETQAQLSGVQGILIAMALVGVVVLFTAILPVFRWW